MGTDGPDFVYYFDKDGTRIMKLGSGNTTMPMSAQDMQTAIERAAPGPPPLENDPRDIPLYDRVRILVGVWYYGECDRNPRDAERPFLPLKHIHALARHIADGLEAQ